MAQAGAKEDTRPLMLISAHSAPIAILGQRLISRIREYNPYVR